MENCWKTVVVAIALVVSPGAQAACEEVEICDDYGSCNYEEVCDNSWDVPATNIATPSVRQDFGIKPIPGIPPIGASRCDSVLVDGYWHNVCE